MKRRTMLLEGGLQLASLPGNGERGLKRENRRQAVRALASLPGNGERGLKLLPNGCALAVTGRFAPRQRGAWIETSCLARRRSECAGHRSPARGAWIETSEADFYREDHRASLPGNGERGLKLLVGLIPGTGGQASLPGNGERGLKHEHLWGGLIPRRSPARGAWIETAVALCAVVLVVLASLPGTGSVD